MTMLLMCANLMTDLERDDCVHDLDPKLLIESCGLTLISTFLQCLFSAYVKDLWSAH